MAAHIAFQTDRKFWDEEHFPYGFARSGDFTRDQAALLENHGQAYLKLATGERQPQGIEEQAFVAFCLGQQPASSVHERVWRRYLDIVQAGKKRFSLGSAISAESNSYVLDLDD